MHVCLSTSDVSIVDLDRQLCQAFIRIVIAVLSNAHKVGLMCPRAVRKGC